MTHCVEGVVEGHLGKFIVHCKSTVCTGGYAYGVGVL